VSKAKKRAAGVGDVRPMGEVELLPGDVCDVLEDGKPTLLGAVYAGWLQRGHAFRVAGEPGFVWPGAAAHIRVNQSPNRLRKAEAADAEVIDPLLRAVADLPLLKDLA
jgi:hypothetical protein